MTPEEYGRLLAEREGPLTADQIEQAARVLAQVATTEAAA